MLLAQQSVPTSTECHAHVEEEGIMARGGVVPVANSRAPGNSGAPEHNGRGGG